MVTGIIDVDHTTVTDQTLAAMRASGLEAVIAKCTEGCDFVDPSFVHWRDECAAIPGLLFAAYHFGTNSTPGDVQARWFLAHAHPDATMVLDWEWSKHGNMTLENAELFAQTVFDETGRYPILYTSRQFVHEMAPAGIPSGSILAKCPLWICWYADPPVHLPVRRVGTGYEQAPWYEPDLWQYTNGGCGPRDTKTYPHETPGINGRKFDRSAFDGDSAALREWWLNCGRERGPQCATSAA